MINIEFILASASPRRIQLLRELNLNFKVVKPDVSEIEKGELSPYEISEMNSFMKAESVAERFPSSFVAGFDTLVEIHGEVLGKPKDVDDAERMLKRLSGKAHRVITGFAIVCKDKGFVFKSHCTTEVWFKELTDEEISWYLSTKEPFDKAGAYAIQGKGAFMVKKISGSYTNVVGLPLAEFIEVLRGIEHGKIL